jgi:hypothetical protein
MIQRFALRLVVYNGFTRRLRPNKKQLIHLTLDEACEAKNMLHECAGALQREAHHEGNTIKRFGLEKMHDELFALSRLIQSKVDITQGEQVHRQGS